VQFENKLAEPLLMYDVERAARIQERLDLIAAGDVPA